MRSGGRVSVQPSNFGYRNLINATCLCADFSVCDTSPAASALIVVCGPPCCLWPALLPVARRAPHGKERRGAMHQIRWKGYGQPPRGQGLTAPIAPRCATGIIKTVSGRAVRQPRCEPNTKDPAKVRASSTAFSEFAISSQAAIELARMTGQNGSLIGCELRGKLRPTAQTRVANL